MDSSAVISPVVVMLSLSAMVFASYRWFVAAGAALVVATMLMHMSSAHAATCTEYRVYGVGNTSDWMSSQNAACSDYLSKNPGDPNCGAAAMYQGTMYSTCIIPTGATAAADGCHVHRSSAWVTAQGGSMGDAVVPFQSRENPNCSCVAGTVEVNGVCVPKCPLKANKQPTTGPCAGGATCVINGDLGSAPTEMCDDGCTIKGDRTMVGKVDDKWYTWAENFKYSGQSCTPGAGSPNYNTSVPTSSTATGPSASQPPKGKCPGTVNGVEVYVDCSSTSTTTTSSTTSSSSSTSSTSAGTSTSTTETTCANGSCTTTTRTDTTNNDGTTKTTVTGTTQPKSEYCQQNPTSPHCGNGPPSGNEEEPSKSSFGGTCGTFTCSGDAATCAIARATSEAKCALTPSTGILDVAGQLQAGTFGPDLTTKAKSVSNFTQANPFSSTCPPDLVFQTSMGTITIPLASKCTYLQMAGNLLLAFTLIMATIFVVKGF